MPEWIALSDLDPSDQDEIVAVLAHEAERLGDPRWLGRALAGGDLLGDRDPIHVPPAVRERIAVALTRHCPPTPCDRAPDCPHPACHEGGGRPRGDRLDRPPG